MKKLVYLILSISLCSAGIGTAAHFSPRNSSNIAENDTIIDDAQGNTQDSNDQEDEFGTFTPTSDDEFGEMHDDSTSTPVDDANNANTPAVKNDTISDYELPEGMRIDVDQEMKEWNAQQYLYTDSAAAKVVDKGQLDDKEYIARLRRIPAIMELPYNDIVRQYIEKYANHRKRSVSYMLGAQNFYMPFFEDALDAQGCPLELRYLPVIESALDPQATSSAGAAGLWQFMPSTGKDHGLEINSLVDERRDVVKSSQAAAEHFKKLYNKLGDWTLVIAAYNCGTGSVEKAIARANGERDYWKIYPYLPKETRGYVPAFIAANYIMYYYCEHGIVPMQAKMPIETDTVVVNRDLHFQQVCDLCGIGMDELKSLNPQYRRDIVPGYWRPCALRLPADMVTKFIQWGDSIYNYKADELLSRRSTVTLKDKKGSSYDKKDKSDKNSSKNNDSATKKEKKEKKDYSEDKSEKKSSKKDSSDKKSSKKSSSDKKSSKKDKSSKKQKKSSSSTITIKKGDTLIGIAHRNGTTVEKLKKLNGIKDDNIREGKSLKVK